MLYIIGTPIGNLGDITLRALETLKSVDFIACEDTRVTSKLLARFNIRKSLVSYREHNQATSGAAIAARLSAGENGALVSDAGMPAVSDPGAGLIALCRAQNIAFELIPGVSAVTCAVAASRFGGGRFCFEGFLSASTAARRKHLAALLTEERPLVFYEAPHKLPHTLRDMLDSWGDRQIDIFREMTKLHSETICTTLSEAIELFAAKPPRGEFTLVVQGCRPETSPRPSQESLNEAVCRASELTRQGVSVRDAAKRASEACGVPKNVLYHALIKG